MFDRNCLSFWFPKIREAGLPVPRTSWIDCDGCREILNVFDGNESIELPKLAKDLRSIAETGGFSTPLFLRTGQTSGKHNWDQCCFVADLDKMEDHIVRLVEWSEMAGFMGLPYDVWVIRQMLETNPAFLCEDYGGFPVVREFRFFVDSDQFLYHQPYWPHDALKMGAPDNPHWESRLPSLHALTKREFTETRELACAAGRAVGGKWSVDILSASDGWYVTDMAEAEQSWGWDESKIV